ncbi:hypothetical protein EXU57_12320 [Segetibacter sp. 3557_3]|uniref:hypothetical protein n=1 Tax=Segetibacter sp. 3557_3 TaxID=2547429 RepID=UPI001058F649|nr:hypothetical protein [Segetibacter sp. 3557_3]TDH25489.1 hypothetical protein EXU57_12320 [Segetibacter sp. 3557_3]
MKNCLLVLLFCMSLFACKNKSPLAGDEKVAMNDFIEAFAVTRLPYTLSDTGIQKLSTTDTISHSVFTQFVPDTLLTSSFKKERRLTLQPLARFGEKGKETYLTLLARSKTKEVVYLLVFTRKNVFSTGMPLLSTSDEAETYYTSTIDNRLNISVQKEWTSNNDLLFSRTIYGYNNAGLFTVVMTETNDQSRVANDINNPLDTLPKKNKYSGDYVKSKTNFLTLRDGSTPDSYLFFVHFENDDDEPCNGEVKGEVFLKTPTSGVFSEQGDPCVIDFTFDDNKVKVKEQGSCGSHRGIKCFFNDTYTRKKEPKPAKKDTPAKKRK